VLNRQ